MSIIFERKFYLLDIILRFFVELIFVKIFSRCKFVINRCRVIDVRIRLVVIVVE